MNDFSYPKSIIILLAIIFLTKPTFTNLIASGVIHENSKQNIIPLLWFAAGFLIFMWALELLKKKQ